MSEPPSTIETERLDPEPAGQVFLLGLDEPAATDVGLTGGKAAALARVRTSGFATLPGVVLTTALSRRRDQVGTGFRDDPIVRDTLKWAIDRLGAAGPLIVRSSAVGEDTAESSKAGQFESVLDVTGVDELAAAVQVVDESRRRAGALDEPIAVLIQPMIDPAYAGVAFGVDPVSGRSDRRVVTAVRGTPDRLVSGEVDGSRWVLDPRGSVVEAAVVDGVDPGHRTLQRLVELIDDLAATFGHPQDVEWALDDQGAPIVLQSRPVTTAILGTPTGPVYGPGPVAETFPEVLSPLEVDLWVEPLREGMREAIRISGAVAERDLETRDLVIDVDGQVAVDLEVTGTAERHPTLRGRLGARIRQLRTAWRVARLRIALPALAADVCMRADRDLETVPSLDALGVHQLVALITRGRQALRSLHAHEILLGLVSTAPPSLTGAAVALRVLAESRREGLDDAEILRRAPVVLVLTPPRLGKPVELPDSVAPTDPCDDPDLDSPQAVSREALRVRVRWLQELTGWAAAELADRVVASDQLAPIDLVESARLDDLLGLATGRSDAVPEAIARNDPAGDTPAAGGRVDGCRTVHEPATLPTTFRLGDTGQAIAIASGERTDGGTGAGGGTGRGPVSHDADAPPEGSVLVVGVLTPQLAAVLGHLSGIVSESGSVLSHLAILAREAGVAVVVGYPDAREVFPEGTTVTVDGERGQVSVEQAIDEEESP
ncbi:MAG TPA: PEP/pyruvate-binding domain-containing protein [Acidimicrobiales bacterium]|nr:PEP/pyruvate-binding domain-containing protein [Acidimicrobiales bacterium]